MIQKPTKVIALGLVLLPQAHMLGVSDSKIRAMGRWHSDSYLRYIRIPMLPGLCI